VFDACPKTRPPLPSAIAAIYQSMYKANRAGQGPASSLSQRVEAWMHREVNASAAISAAGVHPRRAPAPGKRAIPARARGSVRAQRVCVARALSGGNCGGGMRRFDAFW
jgi:hypothetical protein